METPGEKPQDGSGVSLGEVVLSPEDAKNILERMSFERQRDPTQSTFVCWLI